MSGRITPMDMMPTPMDMMPSWMGGHTSIIAGRPSILHGWCWIGYWNNANQTNQTKPNKPNKPNQTKPNPIFLEDRMSLRDRGPTIAWSFSLNEIAR